MKRLAAEESQLRADNDVHLLVPVSRNASSGQGLVCLSMWVFKSMVAASSRRPSRQPPASHGTPNRLIGDPLCLIAILQEGTSPPGSPILVLKNLCHHMDRSPGLKENNPFESVELFDTLIHAGLHDPEEGAAIGSRVLLLQLCTSVPHYTS